MLDEAQEDVLFVTNFSALTLREAEKKLEDCGIGAVGRVLTSAMAAASLVEAGERVLVCAGAGVSEAVEARGAVALNPSNAADASSPIDAVIVGFHQDFNFERLAVSARAIHDGARLISTNIDPTYPTPDGLLPGNGALTAAIATAGKIEAQVAGKPYAPIAELVLQQLGLERGNKESIVVGDLPATDGMLAVELGFDFGLVLSGVTSSDQARSSFPAPHAVAANLELMVEQRLT